MVDGARVGFKGKVVDGVARGDVFDIRLGTLVHLPGGRPVPKRPLTGQERTWVTHLALRGLTPSQDSEAASNQCLAGFAHAESGLGHEATRI
jgi:hypothetical protein